MQARDWITLWREDARLQSSTDSTPTASELMLPRIGGFTRDASVANANVALHARAIIDAVVAVVRIMRALFD